MHARRGFLLAAVLIASAGAAQAQSYPSRPIKLVVAVIAGGPMDVMGRLVAQQLSTTLGPVFVENRAGAGTTLGAKAVASAEPDGYTLLLGNAATLAIGPTLYKSAGYDPLTSFAPVAFIASVPYVMIVSPGVPARTVAELVAYAKAQPGKLSFGVTNAAPPHAPYEMKGVGPFTHTNPQDRPPEIFGGTNTLHFAAGKTPYVLLPVIP